MEYLSFDIINYKGIKELKLDLSIRPNVNVFTVVGLNESGKTTILEAINFFAKGVNKYSAHKLIPKSKNSNFNDEIRIIANLSINETDKERIRLNAKIAGYKEIEIPDKISVERYIEYSSSEMTSEGVHWHSNLSGIKRKSTKVKEIPQDESEVYSFMFTALLPPIIYYSNFLFDLPPRIYLEEFEGESESDRTYRLVIQDILDSLDEKLNIDDHLIDRIKSNDEGVTEALESTLYKMGARISEVVFSAWSALFNSKGKEIVVKEGIEEILDDEVAYLELRLKEQSNRFQIAERSLGFRWFFAFLLFTEFRKSRAENLPGRILFLLDEPASNLHPTAQKNLLSTFENLVDRCTLIYTTHSHHLINPKWLSGSYIALNKTMDYDDEFNYNSANTDIECIPYKNFAAKNPDKTTYFQPILDCLEYQPGLLEEVTGIILTEGKFDYYVLKYIDKLIFNSKYKLNFYPGSGADHSRNVISLYMAWNRDFIILLDSDKAGLRAKNKYIKLYGPEVEDRIFTYEDIKSNYKSKSLEDFFETKEKIDLTQMFDNSSNGYIKSKFNSSIQELLVKNETYKFHARTVKRFETIMEFLSRNLH